MQRRCDMALTALPRSKLMMGYGTLWSQSLTVQSAEHDTKTRGWNGFHLASSVVATTTYAHSCFADRGISRLVSDLARAARCSQGKFSPVTNLVSLIYIYYIYHYSTAKNASQRMKVRFREARTREIADNTRHIKSNFLQYEDTTDENNPI